jgi:hypothetical protein
MATDNNNNKIDSIIVQKPAAVLKSYSALTLLANILISLSAVGFTAIGALTQIDVVYLVGIMSVLSIFGFAGRFIQQDISGTDKEGPMGFKGLSIRFVWFIERSVKGSWEKLKGTFLGLFGKDAQ